MNKLEALADAIMKFNGYLEPDGDLYKLRNPGGLMAASPRHDRVGDYRVFPKAVNGYQSLLYDLERKVSGESYTGLKLHSQLVELLRVYGFRDDESWPVFTFLSKALGVNVTRETPLAFFGGT